MTTAQTLASISQTLATPNSPLGMRNRIINGCMRVSQRGGVTTPIGSVVYGAADRWFLYATGSNVVSDIGWASPCSKSALHIVGTSGNTGLVVGQRIESLNSFDLASQVCTLSAWVWSNIGVPPLLQIGTPNSTDSFGSMTYGSQVSFTPSTIPANQWTRISYTFIAPLNTQNGIEFQFQWGSVIGTTQVGMSGVQFEAGPTATNFELRPYNVELASCSRYYTAGTFFSQTSGASYGGGTVMFPQPMRINPTVNATFTYSQAGSGQVLGGTATAFGFNFNYLASSAGGYTNCSYTASAEI